MKKKQFILFPLLALVLSSCLFDTDDDGLSSWLSDQGMPSSYKVQMVTVSDLKPESVRLNKDTLPRVARARGAFGASSNLAHDVVFDFALDSAFLANLKAADSAKSLLFLYLLDTYYNFKYLPSDILPIEEDVKLNVSWIISDKLNDAEYLALASITDSAWFSDLESWKSKKSADTTFSVSINKNDSLLTIDMPRALVNDVRKNVGNRRLQLRLSAPEASHLFRIYGSGSSYFPRYRMVAMENDTTYSFATYVPTRMATIASNHEECSDCLILHGGVNESIEVEFPSKPIMKALSDFYGDNFPYDRGDGFDVRQVVVMAEVTFYRDDSKGDSELGLPIEVVARSYADSADTSVLRYEDNVLDLPRVLESGYPNMVFHEGDSLSLQVTAGMRDFINRASDGRSFKMTMHLERSVLDAKDSVYGNVIKDNGDTSFVFFPYQDYARYDFSTIKTKPATLKLWLASKRGETDKKEVVKKDSVKSVKTDGKKVATSTARGGK